MPKIYKDYDDRYVAANVIYVATVPSERKNNAEKGILYAFASEEPCVRNGKTVNAVKIDKDTLLDRVLKGAVVCVENPDGPDGPVGYFIPIGAFINKSINKMSGEDSFIEITMLNAFSNRILTMHLVSSEAVLEELGNSGTESEPSVPSK